MANPHKGEHVFEAGGKSYTLQFNTTALVAMEQQLDRGILAIINEIQSWGSEPERIRLGWLRIVLWAGLQKHHPQISLDAAGDIMMEMGGAGPAMVLTTEAFAKAFNVAEDATVRPQEEPASGNGTGTGSSSTSSVSVTRSMSSGPSHRVS